MVVALSIGTAAVLHAAESIPHLADECSARPLAGVIATAGAVARWNQDLGSNWYPVALILTTFPASWIGAKFRLARFVKA